MSKLIQKHIKDPTEKNLQKILEHAKKHPFAALMISKEEAEHLSKFM